MELSIIPHTWGKNIKRNASIWVYLLSLSFFTLGCSSNLLAQEKLDVSAGFGVPELLNIGLRLQLPQAQIGLSGGRFPTNDNNNFSITGDLFYHFGGESNFSERRPWYMRASLSFLRDESKTSIRESWYFGPRIGRDVNFSKKVGMGIDLGSVFLLSERRINKVPPNGWNFDIELPILPSFCVNLFYRL